jgi:two-component system, chemotaxis family, chemotaxis protein CheY
LVYEKIEIVVQAPAVRILVVDDDTFVRDLLRNVLAGHGYEVIEADNGLQGLQVAKCYPCDLVITDQVMPVMNGLDMISRLATERYPARYLLISGYTGNRAGRSGLPCLPKPFLPSELLDAVERLLHEPTLPELEKEWRQAEAQWKQAVTEFQEIISDVPSGTLHPDGRLRIERAASKRRFTYERSMQALHRYKEALQACGVLGATTQTPEPVRGSE